MAGRLDRAGQPASVLTERTFERTTEFPVALDELWAWHHRSGCLERLVPPWEATTVVERSIDLAPGSRTVLEIKTGPLTKRWIAEHLAVDDPYTFRDDAIEGPFAKWSHTHAMRSTGDERSALTDHVRYAVPMGRLGDFVAGSWVQNKIDAMFRYRHEVLAHDLDCHARFSRQPRMKILVSGSSGLVGSALTAFLESGGHEVWRLVRRTPKEREVTWLPDSFELNPRDINGFDAIVHLAGENIAGKRWSDEQKANIRNSRIDGTKSLASAIAQCDEPPKVFVSASAIGYYGDRADERIDEDSTQGEGFLAEVVREWEAAASPAKEAGVRVVNLRTGIVLSPAGGALQKMLLPFKLGGGGVIGSGKQWMSWIALDDMVAAIHHVLQTEAIAGPVNMVAPTAVRNFEFTKTLGRVLRRPTIVPMPAFAARLAFGEMANELLLSGQHVHPRELVNSGFEFRYPNLEGALRHLLGR